MDERLWRVEWDQMMEEEEPEKKKLTQIKMKCQGAGRRRS
jgi:hypothetical protein